MEQYVIKGGNPLVGEVEIAGAKNAALPIISAAIMTDETVTLENLPDVNDVNVLLESISGIGAHVERIDRHTVKINGSTIRDCSVEYEYIRKIRASYYLLGALLGKYNKAEVPLPGGCNIGSRPIDQHLKGFRAIGAKVDIKNGTILASCHHMTGAHIFMDVVSVGATINIMMAASRAVGRTTIENAAKEPHVVDVANFLNSMGANIKGAGTDVIRIVGVPRFHGCTYAIVPDMIEAGTFMMAAAATKGDIVVKNVIPKHMEAVSAKLLEIGCEVEEFDDSIRVVAAKRLIRTHIKTQPYPGYPTDMQPQIAVVLALSRGTSIVTESIFENRFKYVDELTRMGANVKVEGNTAIIDGVPGFTGARISSPDLRAGAALVIAALQAEGISVVDDIGYILRGYEDFDGKLRSLGAEIEMVSSEKEIEKFRLCARSCGADRIHGEAGRCGGTDKVFAARSALHMWEEPCISGREGSGAVFFSGCPLGCVFCQNRSIALGKTGKEISLPRLAQIFLELQEQKANNINLVTPTHYVPQIISAVEKARSMGLIIPIVYNTASYERPETVRMLMGTVDIFLPDLKYYDTALSAKYSYAPDYFDVASKAIREMVSISGK